MHPAEAERELLDQVRQMWREGLARYKPPEHAEAFLRELQSISERARQVLS